MQSLLFIQKKLTEQDLQIIEEALSETRVQYTIKAKENMVVVEGRNDLVHAAKIALQEAGYSIQ
jgi:hypothetical protein